MGEYASDGTGIITDTRARAPVAIAVMPLAFAFALAAFALAALALAFSTLCFEINSAAQKWQILQMIFQMVTLAVDLIVKF